MNRRWLIGGLVGVGIVLGMALFGLGRGRQPAAQGSSAGQPGTETQSQEEVVRPVEVVRVERSTIEEVGEFTGTTEADGSANVVSEASGKALTVTVDVGDRVSKGQLLCRLDTEITAAQARQAAAAVKGAEARLAQVQHSPALQDTSTDTRLEQARQALAATQARLRQAQSGGKIKPQEVESRIAQAKAGLDAAEAQLREVRRGARDQERKRMSAAVEQAESGFKLAESNYNIRKKLYTKGAISGTEYGQSLAYYQQAKAQLEQVRQQYDLMDEGPTTDQVRMAETQAEQAREQLRLATALREQVAISGEDITAARTQVRQAEEALRLAEASREHQVPMSEEDVRAAAAGVAQAKAALDLANTQVRKAAIHSPLDGVVAARMAEPGEMVGTQNAIFRLLDLSKVNLLAQISELEVDRLAEGQEAEVTIDALPGSSWQGRITEIYPAAIPGQRKYIAQIALDNDEEMSVRDGMFGRARIVFSKRVSPLVDRDAIVQREEESFAFRVADGVLERVEVVVGGEQDGRLEIVSGLQGGDVVVATGHTELTAGQRVKPNFVDRTDNADRKQGS